MINFFLSNRSTLCYPWARDLFSNDPMMWNKASHVQCLACSIFNVKWSQNVLKCRKNPTQTTFSSTATTPVSWRWWWFLFIFNEEKKLLKTLQVTVNLRISKFEVPYMRQKWIELKQLNNERFLVFSCLRIRCKTDQFNLILFSYLVFLLFLHLFFLNSKKYNYQTIIRCL